MLGPSSSGQVSTSAHELGTPTLIVPVSSVSCTKSAGIATPGFGDPVGAEAAEAVCPAAAPMATGQLIASANARSLFMVVLPFAMWVCSNVRRRARVLGGTREPRHEG